MIKNILLTFNALILIGYLPVILAEEYQFPDVKQRAEISNQLLNGIEKIDAITIELRDQTRVVNWQTFKDITTKRIITSSNWHELYQSLNVVHFGILNRHSYVIPEQSLKNNSKAPIRWPKLAIGYTWPNSEFFALSNNKVIKSVNGVEINDIFAEFFNLYCNDVHQSGCLRLFSEHMKYGYRFLTNESEVKVNYKNGSEEIITKIINTAVEKQKQAACGSLYPTLDTQLIYESEQVCLFELNNSFILKIFHFGQWGTDYDDIYCQHASENGMCADINNIKQLTQRSNAKTLVIDLQNNRGGTENTPWIAALTRKGFKDNLILYKNTPLLLNSRLREKAFYYNERAENWYQKARKDISKRDKYLPIRTDFCRGSKLCSMKHINSSAYPINYSKIKLIVNEKCVSSCDDFIWRIRSYADAKTYGQLSATDGVFARLNGYLFLTKQGKIKNIIVGEGDAPTVDNAKLLVTYQIPVSKTVNSQGENLEGDASILDFPLAVTIDNFNNLSEENVKRVLSMSP